MKYLKNPSTNPYFNLALDEYAMKHIDCDEDFFFLWQNAPSVIIGKNQNAAQEVNQKFIDENNIKVARRVSGGGAVYHDLNNLNFTFIVNVDDPGKADFKKFVQPVIDALKTMGVEATASGRNDILIDGMKISGNAQRMANGKLMHHGTLMFDVNVDDLQNALNVDPTKIQSKGMKSVRSRVTNIKDHLPAGTTLQDFWDKLQFFLSNGGQDDEIILTDADIAKVEYEAMSRFGTWDWIYGTSPEFNLKNSKRFSGGKVEVVCNVEAGKIQYIRFYGDYMFVNDVKDIEARLIGCRFKRDDVKGVLSTFELSHYFGSITVDELLEVIFD